MPDSHEHDHDEPLASDDVPAPADEGTNPTIPQAGTDAADQDAPDGGDEVIVDGGNGVAEAASPSTSPSPDNVEAGGDPEPAGDEGAAATDETPAVQAGTEDDSAGAGIDDAGESTDAPQGADDSLLTPDPTEAPDPDSGEAMPDDNGSQDDTSPEPPVASEPDEVAVTEESVPEPGSAAYASWSAPDAEPEEAEPDYQWPVAPGTVTRNPPLPWLDWRFSLILPLAALGIVLTLLWQVTLAPDLVTFHIEDAASGSTIPGARVTVGNEVYEARENGTVVIERPDSPVEVTVEAPGYYTVIGDLESGVASSQHVIMRSESQS